MEFLKKAVSSHSIPTFLKIYFSLYKSKELSIFYVSSWYAIRHMFNIRSPFPQITWFIWRGIVQNTHCLLLFVFIFLWRGQFDFVVSKLITLLNAFLFFGDISYFYSYFFLLLEKLLKFWNKVRSLSLELELTSYLDNDIFEDNPFLLFLFLLFSNHIIGDERCKKLLLW